MADTGHDTPPSNGDKSRVLATLFSLYLPGSGQAYTHQWDKVRNIWEAILGGAVVGAAGASGLTGNDFLSKTLFFGGFGIMAGTYVWQVYDATGSTIRTSRPIQSGSLSIRPAIVAQASGAHSADVRLIPVLNATLQFDAIRW